MLVDPAVDILYRLATSNVNISNINTVFISHGHLDHVGGANVISDWLIRAQQNTEIVAPKSVFEEREISSYNAGTKAHHSGWQNTHFPTEINSGENIKLSHGDYLMIPIKLDHGAECYGFKLSYASGTVAYISYTGYTKRFKTSKM
jgi:metal-dependent hydrolase (beta-lactamase superfamily II)